MVASRCTSFKTMCPYPHPQFVSRGRGGSTIGKGDEVLQKDSLYILNVHFFLFCLNNVNISAETVKIQLEAPSAISASTSSRSKKQNSCTDLVLFLKKKFFLMQLTFLNCTPH